MKRQLGLRLGLGLGLALGLHAFAQTRSAVMVTNSTGQLAGPTNFFAANSNLLNQAVNDSHGGGGSDNFDAGFNTNGSGQITLAGYSNFVAGVFAVVQWGSQFLTNWSAHSTNDFLGSQSGHGSNNVFTASTSSNALIVPDAGGSGIALTLYGPGAGVYTHWTNGSAGIVDDFFLAGAGAHQQSWLYNGAGFWNRFVTSNAVYWTDVNGQFVFGLTNLTDSAGFGGNLTVKSNLFAANLGTAAQSNGVNFIAAQNGHSTNTSLKTPFSTNLTETGTLTAAAVQDNGALTVNGSSSLDNGAITTSGTGNFTLNGWLSTDNGAILSDGLGDLTFANPNAGTTFTFNLANGNPTFQWSPGQSGYMNFDMSLFVYGTASSGQEKIHAGNNGSTDTDDLFAGHGTNGYVFEVGQDGAISLVSLLQQTAYLSPAGAITFDVAPTGSKTNSPAKVFVSCTNGNVLLEYPKLQSSSSGTGGAFWSKRFGDILGNSNTLTYEGTRIDTVDANTLTLVTTDHARWGNYGPTNLTIPPGATWRAWTDGTNVQFSIGYPVTNTPTAPNEGIYYLGSGGYAWMPMTNLSAGSGTAIAAGVITASAGSPPAFNSEVFASLGTTNLAQADRPGASGTNQSWLAPTNLNETVNASGQVNAAQFNGGIGVGSNATFQLVTSSNAFVTQTASGVPYNISLDPSGYTNRYEEWWYLNITNSGTTLNIFSNLFLTTYFGAVDILCDETEGCPTNAQCWTRNVNSEKYMTNTAAGSGGGVMNVGSNTEINGGAGAVVTSRTGTITAGGIVYLACALGVPATTNVVNYKFHAIIIQTKYQ